MKEKILVLCVDRDNDVGRKTSFKGPVIGKKENVKLAMELGLNDPEESDTNAIFEAVKICNELSKSSEVEVATVTGHEDEGMKADREILKQLDKITEKFKPKGIVLVSDGAGDEYVLPLLSSKAQVISVRRVIVKQSEKLEGLYYMLQNFIKDSLQNPRLARVVFGLPAIAFILFALFDVVAWRFILGVFGTYLFIKGFHLEGIVGDVINEVRFSLKSRKTSFFLYIAALAIGLIAISNGYGAVAMLGSAPWDQTIGIFVYNSVYLFFLSNVMIWAGWLIGHPQKYTHAVTMIILGFSLTFLLYSAAEAMLFPAKGLINLVLSIILGFLVIVTTFALETKNRK